MFRCCVNKYGICSQGDRKLTSFSFDQEIVYEMIKVNIKIVLGSFVKYIRAKKNLAFYFA